VRFGLTHTLVLVTWITLQFVGCSSSKDDDQLLEELANLDKEAIFERAEELYGSKKYDDARKFFSFVYDTFPNDPLGHKAALRVADTFSVRRDVTSLTEARLRYRDFANRYPNDPDRDYALLMIGHTYTTKRLKPDRDLSSLQEAVNAYRQLVNLYPNSRYASEARDRLADLHQLLAEHEWLVAWFYMRNKRWAGAQWRLEYLKENYPEYTRMDRVDEAMERILLKIGERAAEIKKLMEEAQEKAAKRKS